MNLCRDAFSCYELWHSKRRICRLVVAMNQRAISLQLFRLRLTASIQHLHVECLINSGHFGYKFEVDYAPDVENADQF
jgi:hypothetical protein